VAKKKPRLLKPLRLLLRLLPLRPLLRLLKPSRLKPLLRLLPPRPLKPSRLKPLPRLLPSNSFTAQQKRSFGSVFLLPAFYSLLNSRQANPTS
jgi:hypothetical protein